MGLVSIRGDRANMNAWTGADATDRLLARVCADPTIVFGG